MKQTIDSRINESSKTMQESVHRQLSESTRIIREVTEGLTKLDETNRQVVSFADQLQNLQGHTPEPEAARHTRRVLSRGRPRERAPARQFQMQYPVQGRQYRGRRRLREGQGHSHRLQILLENYNRAVEAREPAEKERYEKAFKADLKVRIDETSKYVLPEEGCMEFAFMFIPSEGVYYDLLSNQVGSMKTSTRDLIEYAFQKKVIIVFADVVPRISPDRAAGPQGIADRGAGDRDKEEGRGAGPAYRRVPGVPPEARERAWRRGLAFQRLEQGAGKIEKDVLRIGRQQDGHRGARPGQAGGGCRLGAFAPRH